MTTHSSRPHSLPPSPFDLRRVAIGRRVSASDPLAGVLAGLAYGEPRRSDIGALASLTAARVADAAGCR